MTGPEPVDVGEAVIVEVDDGEAELSSVQGSVVVVVHSSTSLLHE